MEHLHSKQSLADFSDRELMLLILSNQVKIFRQIQYVEQQVKTGKIEALGLFENTFKEMLSSADDILSQSDRYLNQDDTDKGFLRV